MKKVVTLATTLILVIIMFMIGSISTSALTSGDFEYEILSAEDMTCRITKYKASGTEVVIPEKIDGYTVIEIGNHAFAMTYNPSANKLERVEFGETIKKMGEDCFDTCTKLKEVYYNGTIDDWCKIDFEDGEANPLRFAKQFYIDKQLVVAVVLSEEIEKINDYAFNYYDGIESISFPDALQSIGKEAFYQCSNLKNALIPDSVTSIGESAFAFCNLSYVRIPGGVKTIADKAFGWNGDNLTCIEICEGVEYIGKYAFYANEKLKELKLPKSLIAIDDFAFGLCQNLQSVVIYDNVTTIGNEAFWSCNSLTNVELGKGVTTIESFAFQGCYRLESIIIPESVKTMGGSVFAGASSLKSIVIPKNVSTMGYGIFEGCSALESAIIEGEISTIPQSAFDGCYNLKNLAIPASVKTIEDRAFYDCYLEEIYFAGDEETWNTIEFCGENSKPDSALIHFNVGVEDLESHWSEFITTVEPTCTVDGIAESTCECGHAKTQPISALGHEFSDEFTVDENPTYNTDGTKSRHCVRGDARVDETFIPKLSIAAQKYTGFYKAKGCWYYFNKGQMVINAWKKDSVSWCYLGADGKMVTNKWVRDSVSWCYVGSNGYCVTNKWVADSVGWCYLGSDGRMVTNKWIRDSVGWCYVGADGYCVTNQWVKDSVGWCFLGPDGRMVTNAIVTDSHGVCCVGADGYWAFEVLIYDGYGYRYFDKTGYMVTNAWLEIDGEYLYADYDGYLYVVE